MSPDPIIVNEILDHIRNFVEKPNPKFGGLPICPFARQARVKNQINIQVLKFNLERIDPEVINLLKNNKQRVLIVAHPEKIDPKRLVALEPLYNQEVAELGYQMFSSHPADDFNVAGVHTRRDPYPNLQFVKKSEMDDGRKKLKATRYFRDWPENSDPVR